MGSVAYVVVICCLLTWNVPDEYFVREFVESMQCEHDEDVSMLMNRSYKYTLFASSTIFRHFSFQPFPYLSD
jgi:hypothetical protein